MDFPACLDARGCNCKVSGVFLSRKVRFVACGCNRGDSRFCEGSVLVCLVENLKERWSYGCS